ncbi:uncharacterized protein [Leptinotarsa decemlineata]|uniref:uncharacterized protein n=1 Tax=Leptinotarsa decemlineata TaxID=7539 RepID=UPI003D30CA87
MNLDSLPPELTTENVVFIEACDIQVDKMVENNDLDAIFTSAASISDDLILQAADEKINLLNCIYEQEIIFRDLNAIQEPDTHQELAIVEANTRQPATHEPTQEPTNIQVPDTLVPDTLVPDTLETETHEYYEHNNQEHGNDNQEPNSHSDSNDETYEQRESDMKTDSSGKKDREKMPRNEGAAEISLRKRRKRRHVDRATWKKQE